MTSMNDMKFRAFKSIEAKGKFIKKCQADGTFDGHGDMVDYYGNLTGYMYVRYR